MAVTLTSGIFSVILPNPIFGDAEADLNEMNLGRSMIGGVYTYIKTKRQKLLTYEFTLGKIEYANLETFYGNTLARAIQLDNWKDETWMGYIINDVIENTERRKYDNQVVIQFEGLKLSG